MAQHLVDVRAFFEQLDPKPIDLMGHSRGGHVAFRVRQQGRTRCAGWCWPNAAAS
jgi:pimeloyl-ACP methyl ester carboxylesterase